jgi:DNA-binding CsgD family transcriptional regulator/tetratricopeptide (TPR) repeat protein
MARRVSSPRLVGRTEELAQLGAALERARAGSPAAVLVAGEAGVGKTRLASEFATVAAAAGARVLGGGCVALVEGELAYAPLVEALRGLMQRLEPTAVTRLLAGDRGELARLLPELREPDHPPAEQGLGGEAGRLQLFGVLQRLLARLAGDAPVVLVIEDLHWADRSSLAFLSYLLRNLREERLLLVGTWRSDELPRAHAVRRWLAEQQRSSRVEALELARLSRAELAEQLAGILGTPPPGLVDEVFARSGGNPFFAEELLAAADGREAGLPARLREVLLLRVGDCSPAAQAVLGAAAVAGRRVEERLLAGVAPLGEAELLAGLREAVDRQLLVVPPDQDAYAFRHALVQEAVYGELLPGERTRLHTMLAERLGSDEFGRTGGAAEVAVHWYRAHDLPNALEWSARAAAEADAVRAYAEALGHYERALELWDRVADAQARAGMAHVEVFRRAAEAANVTGDDRRALALIDRALREVDPVVEPVRAALLHERRGLYLGVAQPQQARLEALSEAVRLVPTDPPSTARARLSASYAETLFLAMRIEEAAVAGEEALAMARQLGAVGEAAIALNVVGATQAIGGAFEAGIASLREACRLAEEQGDPDTLTRAYGLLGEVLMQAGRLEDSVAASLSGRAPLRRLGVEGLHYDGWLLLNAAEALFKLGRWDDADKLAAQGLAQARPGSPGAATIVAVLEIGRGEFQAAEAHLEAAKDRSLGGDPEEVRVYLELVAELRAWQGRLEEAQAAVVEGLDQLAGTGEWMRSGRLLCLGLRVEADRAERGRARHDPGEVDAAVRAAEALAARAAATTPNPLVQVVTPVLASGVVKALFDGERSRLEGRPGPDRWQAAAAAWQALGRPYPAAYAQWRQAEALLARGEPASHATEPLRAAHATALRLGARPLLGEVAALARRARIPLEQPAARSAPPAPSPAQRLGLTERELEVLALVADGRSNREIGEALFISGKTASVHISNILRKLGVTSRVQAATAAHRLGLVGEDRPRR